MSTKSKKQSKVPDKIEGSDILSGNQISYITTALLAIFAVITFWIRRLNHARVFVGDTVHFSDDGIPHMRFVESVVANFPHRMAFDPFTNFPYGTRPPGSFGPIFDQTIALISMILGGGDPSQQTIQTVGAYFPVILGTLLVIPIYFIGKHLFNRITGLIASGLYVIFPGSILHKAILGYPDHHIAEILLSSVMMMFFIMGLRQIGEDRKRLRNYGILAGFFFGLYIWVWNLGLLFLLLLALYLFIQFVMNHYEGHDSSDLIFLSHMTLGVPILMLLPYAIINGGFSSSRISYLHILGFIGIMVAMQIMDVLSKELNKRDMKWWYFPMILLGIGVATLGLIYPTSLGESFFGIMRFALIPPSAAYSTVQEEMPFFSYAGRFSLLPLYASFGFFGFAVFPVFAYFIFKTVKGRSPVDVLFTVWTLTLFILMCVHTRNAYYFAVPVILTGSYMLYEIIERTGIFDERKRKKNKTVIGIVLIVLLLVFVYPTAGSAINQARYSGSSFQMDWFDASEWMRYNTPEPDLDYYELYEIPEDGVWQYGPNDYGVMSWWDYGHVIEYVAQRIPNANPYQQGIGGPPIIKYIDSDNDGAYTGSESIIYDTDRNEEYSMTDRLLLGEEPSSGATLSRFKIDEMYFDSDGNRGYSEGETVIRDNDRNARYSTLDEVLTGQVPPIGSDLNILYLRPGASTFLIATEEAEANEILNELGTRYVMNDFLVADFLGASNHVKYVMPYWAESFPDPYNTMNIRLQFFDGNQVIINNDTTLPALRQYRLVHESDDFYMPFAVVDGKTGEQLYWRSETGSYNYTNMKSQILYQGARIQNSDYIAYTPHYFYPVALVKIFEYVEGADVVVSSSGGVDTATISIEIATNQDRTFTYNQTATVGADGKFHFVVPYSTGGPVAGGTQFDTMATSLYTVKVGSSTKEITVTEEQVMNGDRINIRI